MNFKILPFLLLSFLFSHNVVAADALDGTPIGSVSKDIQVEIKTTHTGDFTFYFMPLMIGSVQVDWNDQQIMEYSPAAGENKIVYSLTGDGEKTIKIHVDEDVFMTFTTVSMDVTAIKFYPASNLKEVSLTENKIESLDFSNLSALETLNIVGNETEGSLLNNLVVSSNSLLVTLTIPYNTSLATLDLSNNVSLTKFVGYGAQLSDANMFVNNALLQEINVNKCAFTSLDLSNQTALKGLFCFENQLTGALDLSNSPSLTELNCNSNRLSDIKLNSGIESLETLRCNGNKLSFITFPRVQVTDAYDFYNQDPVEVVLESDGYSIDLTSVMPAITETNVPFMTSDRSYSVAWKAFRANNGAVTALPSGFVTNVGSRYTFTSQFVGATIFDQNVYAQITNTAYPAQISTVKVEITGKTTVGVEDEELDKFSVYPNPFVEDVCVSGVAQGSLVEVIDIQGRVVYSTVLQSDADTLSLDKLSSGVYLIQVNDSGKVYSTKIIKK